MNGLRKVPYPRVENGESLERLGRGSRGDELVAPNDPERLGGDAAGAGSSCGKVPRSAAATGSGGAAASMRAA